MNRTILFWAIWIRPGKLTIFFRSRKFSEIIDMSLLMGLSFLIVLTGKRLLSLIFKRQNPNSYVMASIYDYAYFVKSDYKRYNSECRKIL